MGLSLNGNIKKDWTNTFLIWNSKKIIRENTISFKNKPITSKQVTIGSKFQIIAIK